MPELFRAYGFTFMFFSLEHEPIHIHVHGRDGDAKYIWNGNTFEFHEQHNIKPNDLKKIKKMIDDNADIIIKSWTTFFNKKEGKK